MLLWLPTTLYYHCRPDDVIQNGRRDHEKKPWHVDYKKNLIKINRFSVWSFWILWAILWIKGLLEQKGNYRFGFQCIDIFCLTETNVTQSFRKSPLVSPLMAFTRSSPYTATRKRNNIHWGAVITRPGVGGRGWGGVEWVFWVGNGGACQYKDVVLPVWEFPW